MKRTVLTIVAMFALAGCQPAATRFAPWQIEAQRDQIRDNFMVFATIWSNEVQGDGPASQMAVNFGPDGTRVQLDFALGECSPETPTIYRFDDQEPGYLPCFPSMVGGPVTRISPEFIDGLMKSKRLVIETRPFLTAARQHSFDLEGFGAAFENAKSDGTAMIGG